MSVGLDKRTPNELLENRGIVSLPLPDLVCESIGRSMNIVAAKEANKAVRGTSTMNRDAVEASADMVKTAQLANTTKDSYRRALALRETQIFAKNVFGAAVGVAAHAQSQANIASIRKRAIGQLAGIVDVTEVAAAVDMLTLLDRLGGKSTASATEEKVALEEDTIENIQWSQDMARQLVINRNRILEVAEKTDNPLDIELANESTNEILEIGNKFGIPDDQLPLPILTVADIEKQATATISNEMLELLKSNLKGMEKIAQFSKSVTEICPTSVFASAIANADTAITHREQQKMVDFSLRAQNKRKPESQAQQSQSQRQRQKR